MFNHLERAHFLGPLKEIQEENGPLKNMDKCMPVPTRSK